MVEVCTSRTGPSNALIASMVPAEVKEKPAGWMMDGVGGLARGGGNPVAALRMRGRIGGGGREMKSSQGN
jgi:hypothetical protein